MTASAGAREPGQVLLVHSSDLHVDNTDEAALDRHHGLAGLAAVLGKARSLSADLVLLAGDIFENHRVATGVLQRTAALIAEAALPVVLLPGNHDSVMPDCMFVRGGLHAVSNLHLLGVTHAEAVPFPALDLVIQGRPHVGYDDMHPLPPARPRAARWQVVMAHGHYVPPADWREEAHRAWKISDAALRELDADYVALGHWDRAAPVGDGTVPAFYSGAPHLAGTVNVVRLCPRDGVMVAREPL